MTASSDLWTAFGQMFSMLFLVLALLIAAFYLLKRFSSAKGLGGGKELIQIVTVHHLSPKEKLVLLKVLDETILVGVTAAGISKISEFGPRPDLGKITEKRSTGFAGLLNRKMAHLSDAEKATKPAMGDSDAI